MLNRRTLLLPSVLAITVAAFAVSSAYADGELNLYSSRHYDTDERLYSDFEEQTGIKINRIEDSADVLIERMTAEGANSPADVLLTVDAGRLYRADQAGLLQPIESAVLAERIPENLRNPDGKWYGFSQRARVIFYDENEVADPPQSYQDLADPKYAGKVCARSSSNIYMISLLAAIAEHVGEEAAQTWAQGLKDNLARDPEGGDTDQLRAVASGECDIAVSNTYYFARALGGDVDGLTGSTDMFGVVFPNQDSTGTHVNISGAGVATNAPNRDNAIAFLEYLASDSAQDYFADGNNEYPVVVGIPLADALSEMTPEGGFKADDLNLDVLGKNQALAVQIYDRIGYE
ncbi:Fe(3+) ABC transporter substrate-binding protein [Bauldia sp.]|uniref:Fe(3+) ABC transporter substrate-binding protein n=1 Tax=Bauldia sp. TaxID=2575872 RepID=UPI003BA971BB